MADIFVSYARRDRARIAPLVRAIEAQGWSVWWDPEIAPGQEFDRLISAELKRALAVVVVWTPISVESRWVRGEARDAADRGILVPVRFEGADLPIDVRAFHTTDLDEWHEDPASRPFQEMVRALQTMVARPVAPRPAPPRLEPPVTYRCGSVEVDLENRRLTRDGVEVVLEPKGFAVIGQLLARPGALLTRQELLKAVWGHEHVTPSTLNRLITLARRAFGDDSDAPRFIQTVHRSGYRYVGPIEKRYAPEPEARARFGPPASARLPSRVDALIGREDELARLEALFGEHRAVTILGSGGMGKTQCALEWSRRNATAFPDGVWFFDLAPAQRAADWLQSLAIALGVPPGNEREMIDKISPVLRGRRALIVLDNCDRIATGVGSFVAELLRGTDELKFLATSQAQLNCIGEHVMRMPPLAIPEFANADAPVDLEAVGQVAALALLLARVKSIRPEFALTVANAATLVEICKRLDGMPLALELASARFALLSPEQVLDRLTRRFRFLTSDVSGRDSRHRNLQVLLEWSFSLLAPDEQQLLASFGVFVQGWTIEGSMALAIALGRDPDAAVDLLGGLIDKSLVSVNPSLSPTRYYLLESVREFALEQLRATGREADVRDAHLSVFRQMAERSHRELLSSHMREHISQIGHEHGNIDGALAYAIATDGRREAALAIVGSLTLYLKASGALATGFRWCQQALAGCEQLDTLECGRALLCLAIMSLHITAARDTPEEVYLRAVKILSAAGDKWREACANGFYAMWLANGARAEDGDLRATAAERLSAELGDPWLRGLAGLARGWVLLAQGDRTAAIPVLKAVKNLGHDLHQRHFIGMYIGLAHFELGDTVTAAAEWGHAMIQAIEVSHARGIAGSVEGCGYVAQKLGEPRDAARYLAFARQIRERTECGLFNFWLPCHEAAEAALRLSLGADYDACCYEGRQMREEDAANEVHARLRYFGTAARSGTA